MLVSLWQCKRLLAAMHLTPGASRYMQQLRPLKIARALLLTLVFRLTACLPCRHDETPLREAP